MVNIKKVKEIYNKAMSKSEIMYSGLDSDFDSQADIEYFSHLLDQFLKSSFKFSFFIFLKKKKLFKLLFCAIILSQKYYNNKINQDTYFRDVCISILEERNTKYGDAYKLCNSPGIYVLIIFKLQRIVYMLTHQKHDDLLDSIIDLTNYSMLFIECVNKNVFRKILKI